MLKFESARDTLKTRGFVQLISAVFYLAIGSLLKLFNKKFIKKRIYNYEMFLDLHDKGISRTLLLFGERELEHKSMLEEFLKPGMTVLDIGANIGYYALMEMKLIGDDGTLIAVEPSESNVGLLKMNLELNGYSNIEIHNAAVSNESGTKQFFLSEMSNLNTFHDTGTGSLHLSGKTVAVPTFTVPQIMNGRHLDLIRMDVEGHEVEVINGLLEAIEKKVYRPSIIFETHLSRYDDEHNFEEPLRRLLGLGYEAKLVGTSAEHGTQRLEGLGYTSAKLIKSDGVERAIFSGVSNLDLVELICKSGGIRTVLLCPSD